MRKIFDRMWEGKVLVAGNKRDKNGEFIKYVIQRKDQYRTIMLKPGKVIYEREKQIEIIVNTLNFLDKIHHDYYSNPNDDDNDEMKKVNGTLNSITSSIVGILSSNI